ncbi:MAG: response regulator [Fibrobacteria bacterium]|nr:response regulator [Fibrobacteria bacterium]
MGNDKSILFLLGDDKKGLLNLGESLGPSVKIFDFSSFEEAYNASGQTPPSLIIYNLKTASEKEILDQIAIHNLTERVPVLILYKNSRQLAPIYESNYSGWVEYLAMPVPYSFLINKIKAYLHKLSISFSHSHAELEAEREQFKEKLHQSQNLTVLGQIASGVAHDFNNVLGGILGYAEMAKLKFGKSTPDLIKYTDSIVGFSKRAGDLTKMILSFASDNKKKKKSIDIHILLSEVIDLLYHTIDKRYQLKKALNAETITLVGDYTLLQNAIINISLNARDAMPDGGEISFSTENILITASEPGNYDPPVDEGMYVSISISDTGTGIKPEIRENIFKPFFTTKEKDKGTGLGLPSVLKTVLQHKGTLRLESEEQKGTTIQLLFPVGSAEEKANDEIFSLDIPQGMGHILVIDDEDGFREIIKEILTDFGYDVSLAADGYEALDVYQQNDKDIDLLIIDMNLPRQTGTECFRSLKKINPDIKAIMCTGFSLNEETEPILEEGVSGFIQKPFEMKLLLDLVAKVIASA